MTAMIEARTLLSPDREVRGAAIEVSPDGRVAALTTAAGGTDGTVTPGMVDVQCNGAAGATLATSDGAAFGAVADALLRSGTTAWCPTLPTAPPDAYPRFLEAAAASAARPAPRMLGVHLEGPFLSPVRAGAHPPELLRAVDTTWLADLLDGHPGLVRLVTIAPELPGALELIELCCERGVTVSLGHTDATAEQAEAAFEAGATMVTHLFNAMRPLNHRDPGIIGAALAHPEVTIGLIADGAHVDGRVASFFARALGPRRTSLVSDAVAHPVPEPLRGGFVLLDGAVANLVAWGVGFRDAVTMASLTPARAVGVPDVGHLEVGAWADCVRWRDGRVDTVYVGGEPR